MSKQNVNQNYFPNGGGELGQLIREKDWSTTSVGSQSQWSQSLKTSLDILLNSRFPMFLFWGPDLICFYNDAFRPSLGIDGKHPFILGQPAELAWKETWNIIKPMIYDVLEGNGASWYEDLPIPNFRNGKIEQVNWTFSYSPAKDDNGKVAGIMVHCVESTQKVTLNNKLIESERRYRLILDQAPAAIATFRGPTYITEFANEQSCELWGRKSEDVLGKPVLETLPELASQGIKQLLDNVYQTGKKFSASELPIHLRRDGELQTIYANFSYHPLYNTDGEIDGVITIGHDVTDQVQGHKTIEDNEEKLNMVIEASELGIFDYDVSQQTMVASSKLHDIFGLPPEQDITHQDFVRQIHPSDLPIRNKAHEEAKSSGVLEYTCRLVSDDNSMKWVELKGKVSYDANHQISRILGTARDVSADKINLQKLSESEHKFRLLADSLPQHIWTADPEGNLNYFNQSVYDFSGLTPSELSEIGWLEIVHPDDKENNVKSWTQSIQSGSDFLCEHRFRKYDGTYRWQLSRAKPQFDEDGKIKMWVGSSTDIHDQKEFTNELERLVVERTNELAQNVKELDSMNKELQSFAYISSHDLQEPLRKIQTFSSLLMDDEYENLSEEGREHFKRMQNAAKRMQLLIGDLLAYSRSTIAERKFELTDLNTIINELKLDLKEEIVQHNAILESNHLCTLNIIPFQFRQLLQNLISNSLKFSVKDRQPKIQIQSEKGYGSEFDQERLSSQTHYCHIKITDNGIGFEQEYNERIFELFQRLHGKDKYNGTGIGLAIVKKIVENHHGIISATGRPNQGAIFDIYLPEN